MGLALSMSVAIERLITHRCLRRWEIGFISNRNKNYFLGEQQVRIVSVLSQVMSASGNEQTGYF